MFGHADFTLAPSLSLYSAACIRRIALSHIRWPSFVTEFDQVLDTSRDIVLAFLSMFKLRCKRHYRNPAT